MTDSTTPQDSAAMPPASDGSVAGKPAAFRVDVDGIGSIMPICRDWAEVQGICNRFGDRVLGIAPLYEETPTLTDAEREAVNIAQSLLAGTAHGKSLGSLLERLG